MKGISHFATGVAIATFFPTVVQRAALGSILPVLGGIAGILPDTLDFRFARFAERYDVQIDPGPEPDAPEIARQLATAMQRAYDDREPQNVLLRTVPLGPAEWREYGVRFDAAQGEVRTRIGPIVTTGGLSFPGSAPEHGATARLQVDVPLAQTYEGEIKVDIFQGPSIRLEREGDQLHMRFLDWHRRWSHSLLLAGVLGLAAAGAVRLAEIVAGGSTTDVSARAGLVAGLGFAAHVLEDQLGHMGTNLLAPLTRRRLPGLRLLHSGDAIPNLLTVWTALALSLFNLDRFSAQPQLDPLWFLGLAVALPVAVLGTVYALRKARARRHRVSAEVETEADILCEIEESQGD